MRLVSPISSPLNIHPLHQPTLRANSFMGWQPKIIGINKDSFHPIIVLKVGLALRAFHLADLWFQNTRTEGALDVSFWLGS